MADSSPHPTDLLLDAVDDRLDAEARATLDAHLASCASCRDELAALQWTKAQAGRLDRAPNVPDDLDARLRSMLDREDREAESRGLATPRRSRVGVWAAGLAAAAAVIFAVLWFQARGDASVPAAAAAHARAFRSGALSLEVVSSDPQALEAHFRATRAPASRVYDFGMMGHTLAGARTHTLGNHATALAAYRDAEGPSLLCEMYVGRVDALPPPAERRTHDGIDFLVYRDADVTVVFWQEGTVVCVLSGFGDPEAIVALAFAKAVKV